MPDISVYYGPDTYMGANLAVMLRAVAQMTDDEIRALHPQHNRWDGAPKPCSVCTTTGQKAGTCLLALFVPPQAESITTPVVSVTDVRN